jgi:DNA-binding winged helix-turn-helix (wHTH) protein/Tfp pilus assembly protein PilF
LGKIAASVQDSIRPTTSTVASTARVRVGACSWEPSTRVLRNGNGEEVKLSWRALLCWATLVDAQGETVTRETLQRLLWGETSVEESSLSHVIVSLRKAVDPAPNGKSYIETVPRIGFRLGVPVSVPVSVPVGVPDGPVGAESEAEPKQNAPAPPGNTRAIAVGAAVLSVLAVAGWFGLREANRSGQQAEAERIARLALASVRRGSVDQFKAAREQLNQALVLAPGLPLAKAALAELAVRGGNLSFDQALTLGREAAAADPACAECRAILGFIQFTRFWNWPEARLHLAAATALPDAPAIAHVWHAQVLGVLREFPLAHRQIARALQLDPALANAASMKGTLLYLEGRYAEANVQLDAADALDPSNPNPPYWQSRVSWLLNDTPSAVRFQILHNGRYSGHSLDRQEQDRLKLLARMAKDGPAAGPGYWLEETALHEARRVNTYNRAVWHVWSGAAPGTVLDALEEAERNRPFNLIYVAADPVFAPLHREPRFRALLQRLKLPD